MDEHTQTESVLEAERVYDVQRQSTQQSLLTVDGDTFSISDGTVLSSPINDVLPVPIQGQLIDDTWMLGAGRLFRWTEGSLSEVSLNGESIFRRARHDSLAILTPHLEILQPGGQSCHFEHTTFNSKLRLLRWGFCNRRASEIHRYHDGDWTYFVLKAGRC